MYTSESLPNPPTGSGILRGRLGAGRQGAGLGRGGARLRRLGHHTDEAPVLHLRERTCLHDLDGIANVRLVLLVMGVADGPPTDVLSIARVLDQARNLDPARLVHLVAGDNADLMASLAPLPGRLLLLRLGHRLLPLPLPLALLPPILLPDRRLGGSQLVLLRQRLDALDLFLG